MAVDSLGYVYVAGHFEDTVDFDTDGGIDEHTSEGDTDVYLSKFALNGGFEWTRTLGGSDNDGCSDVVVDETGNAYVAGRFQYVVDFDPGPGIDEHTSSGSYDTFLTKIPYDGDW